MWIIHIPALPETKVLQRFSDWAALTAQLVERRQIKLKV